MSRARSLLATVFAAVLLVCGVAFPAAAGASVNTGFGPGGPVFVGGVLNYDSVNGQTMLHAILDFDTAATAAQQSTIPDNGWPIETVSVFPSVTATAAGEITYPVTRGYFCSAGHYGCTLNTWAGYNVYELPTTVNVDVLPQYPTATSGARSVLASAEANLMASWRLYHP